MNTPARVLLVDDERRNLDVLESVLQSKDYELISAVTAEEALMHLLAADFAALVLDINMPGMGGLELAGLIKQRRRTQHIPIIFLTAYSQDDKDVLDGYGTGAVDYLTKPINPLILRSKIGAFVELFSKTRALAASNQALELEIAQRQRAEEALRQVNTDLEVRVRERTADLERVNAELRAREAALRASEAEAQGASRAKDAFLAALSHELRTPLSPALLLASEAAKDASLPAVTRRAFETIRKGVELEARLIDDLLDLTRISRGKLLLEFREVDLHAVLDDAAAIVRPELQQKGIEFVVDLAARPTTVWGDGVRLQQVVWNLLKNALKFTPAGGRVVMATSTRGPRPGAAAPMAVDGAGDRPPVVRDPEGGASESASTRPDGGDPKPAFQSGIPAAGEAVVTITDSGIGLTEAELERAFQAFAQGDHARTPGVHQFGGLGLGLAISRSLVEMHGGRLEAASPGRGRGASFTLALPLLRTQAVAGRDAAGPAVFPAGPHPADVRPTGRHLRILLVEDDASTLAALGHLLRGRNHEVLTAASAAAARRVAAQHSLDLVISDLGLPDGGGAELFRSLRDSQPDLPGIALSGYGTDEDIARSREAGFRHHLTKPIAMEVLDGAIASAVPAQVLAGKAAP